jgi:hypothetical protein
LFLYLCSYNLVGSVTGTNPNRESSGGDEGALMVTSDSGAPRRHTNGSDGEHRYQVPFPPAFVSWSSQLGD